MERVLAQWGIRDAVAIAPTALGSGKTWTVDTADARRYLLKAINPERAEREHAILRQLSALRLPVATPIATMDGRWYTEDREGQRYCLYPRLPGESASEHNYGPEAEAWAERFGRSLGLLHAGLRACHDPAGAQDPEFFGQVRTWAIPRIREADGVVGADAIDAVWRDAKPALEALAPDLPRQLIHRDPHPGNMLFSGAQLTGWLDLEQVRLGPRLFDVCYCAGSLLVEGFEDPVKANRWPGLFRALVRGYEEHHPLIEAERRATYGMFVMIEVIFIAFFIDRGLGDIARMSERLLQWMAEHREALAL